MLKRLVASLLILLALLPLAGCDSLPGELERRAEQMARDFDGLSKMLTEREAEFTRIQGNAKAWAFYAPYAERENWKAAFTQVRKDLAGLKARYDREVKPILDRDESDDAAELTRLLDGIAANFDPLKAKMRTVADRMKLLKQGYDNADAWIATARTKLGEIERLIAAVTPIMAQAKVDFPNRASDIDERFVPLSQRQRNAKEALERAEAEYAKHKAGDNADYAAFADAVKTVERLAVELVDEDDDYREQLASLSEQYSTILRDMKIEYRVTIGRSSWDNDSDWDNTPDNTYPAVMVSQTDFEYLSRLPQGERAGSQGYLARYYRGFSGWNLDVKIDQAVWKRLRIKPDAAWPSRYDDDSSFWIEDLEPVYYHKYAEVNGTNVTEGDWEEVDEEVYGQYADAFGMAIESKKLGQFEDEAVREPTPPGMAMVGDERYGRWVTNNQGTREWSWLETYAFYHLMFGGGSHHYYYDDYRGYRDWRSDRRRDSYGWYGSDRNRPVYGTNGSYTRNTSAYRSSPGARQTISPSVRAAGRTARARGAAGAGK